MKNWNKHLKIIQKIIANHRLHNKILMKVKFYKIGFEKDIRQHLQVLVSLYYYKLHKLIINIYFEKQIPMKLYTWFLIRKKFKDLLVTIIEIVPRP